ncbi:ribosomal protein L4 domain-containing protein [Clohesyomyces aquaticus]|uniref:Large ribosomal subunit protein uL4m n=1 Tax=Clohesyomyces aquaticus TaxID=1231657 RepID=A0A1Y1Y9Q0_9PLEO|nr:ribosomal protein L4 domain-containing protein [Clohesyomyces aquaticus]
MATPARWAVPLLIRNPVCSRTITTSTSAHASVSDITTSVSSHIPPLPPIDNPWVHATIHSFPSLEPLLFRKYPPWKLALPIRRDILHRAVVYEADNARQGTANTKWRSEVHGSAHKIRPQKGSGRARLGDKKSPMLRGGGVAFGPKPRDFGTDLPGKVYNLAWRTALSHRFRKGELIIVQGRIDVPGNSRMDYVEELFRTHGWGRGLGRSLLVTLGERPMLESLLDPRDGRKTTWTELDVRAVLGMGRVVIEERALSNLFKITRLDGRIGPSTKLDQEEDDDWEEGEQEQERWEG